MCYLLFRVYAARTTIAALPLVGKEPRRERGTLE
jgi:hypothetical protein